VDYETFCRIRDHLIRQQLTVAQTAKALGLDAHNVAKWADIEQSRQRAAVPRTSKLDAHKGQIVRWLDTHANRQDSVHGLASVGPWWVATSRQRRSTGLSCLRTGTFLIRRRSQVDS